MTGTEYWEAFKEVLKDAPNRAAVEGLKLFCEKFDLLEDPVEKEKCRKFLDSVLKGPNLGPKK